ncbi:hypothetical protein C0J52_14900 [Blattella germanica]|nr:hypothetical protein C0J52_14900 [Blattella germanica]
MDAMLNGVPPLRHYQPLRLEKLALDAIAGYVKLVSLHLLTEEDQSSRPHKRKERSRFRNLLRLYMKISDKQIQKLVEDSKPSFDRGKYLDSATHVCQRLQQLFEEMVPPCTVNELTVILLDTVSKVINDKRSLADKMWARNVLQDLVNTVIHPAVSRLRITHDLYYLGPMICARLPALSNLEELDLLLVSDISDLRMLIGVIDACTEQLIMSAMQHLPRLKTFRFPCNCTDNIIFAVTRHCQHLERLNFHCSKVTDASIDNIVTLRNLVELNILRTSISLDACVLMLNTLADKNVQLKSFGCSTVSHEVLTILVKKFPKLVTLNLAGLNCEFSLLSQLEYLQVLKLQSGIFTQILKFLTTAGHRLLSLELARILGTDIKLIGEKCTSLRRLVLRCCYTLPLQEIPAPLPGLVNLDSLSIHTKHDSALIIHILSQCMNVRQLTLITQTAVTFECIDQVLKRNPLKHLEELCLECHGQWMSRTVIALFLFHCTSLTVLKGAVTWRHSDEDVQSLNAQYPGIRIY